MRREKGSAGRKRNTIDRVSRKQVPRIEAGNEGKEEFAGLAR